MTLPPARHKGNVSVEEAIFGRRSIRAYTAEPLSLEEVSQLLWAAGGITVDAVTGPTRSYPSAGAMYPLTIYLVAGKVNGLEPGIYRYNWHDHSIDQVKDGDFREQLMLASLGQRMVGNAPANIVITAVYSWTERQYGKRGEVRYVPMDTGHAGQNVELQAEALGLGSVIVGAFNDDAVKEVLGIKDEEPLYIIPVGKK
ncbi:MAG: nitroreductase [Omnitrophica bacterium RBG_13_46_9]|nr:MAG: nitroreductase [Omnitrophica bacterium RBG_13_46_9]